MYYFIVPNVSNVETMIKNQLKHSVTNGSALELVSVELLCSLCFKKYIKRSILHFFYNTNASEMSITIKLVFGCCKIMAFTIFIQYV